MKLMRHDDFFNDLADWDPTHFWLNAPRVDFPKVDIEETDKDILVKADIPGYDPKKISIDISGRSLTLSAEQHEEHEEKKGSRYFRRERFQRSFHRTIGLPSDIKTEEVKAQCHNGMLTITLPKKEQSSPSGRHIPVEEV